MKTLAIVLMVLLASTAALAAGPPTIRIRPSADRNGLDVVIREAPVVDALRSLALHLDRSVVPGGPIDATVSYEANGVEPERALREIVAEAGLVLDASGRAWIVRDPEESRVTLDVVGEGARSIMREVATRCGFRNLVIDPGVAGTGTFRFRDVPCSTAIEAIVSSLGLRSRVEPNSVLVVER